MPVPALVDATGTLPLGRYECTEEEIRAAFVDHPDFSSSVTRINVWNDWETARELVTSTLTVHSVWIAGSFTTSKLDPGDIDIVFLVNGPEFDALDAAQQGIIYSFANGSAGAQQHGLQVDSYVIPWYCFPSPNPYRDPAQLSYYASRGYWDDWWLRARSGPKGNPPMRQDAFPRRGYLEVKFRDYC
ncbi:hypothetical protein GCM10010243_46980 [Streptomyces matensis]|uniref:DUF6932 family protein n=1 Tax=Streptomyces althioticus TaxID=83380 RepID=UPI0019C1EFEB|nr:hypothetical protein GCM10010243_46980 [Streptomyces matensis]